MRLPIVSLELNNMFTGIVAEIGVVKQLVKNARSMVLTIAAKHIIPSMHVGDSIAVNGVCVTVTKFTNNYFVVDVMPETFMATSLKYLKANAQVNLEPAVTLQTKLGGHLVSGHVDGVALIKQVKTQENALIYQLELTNSSLLKFCVQRGSIAIDGASLTIFAIKQQSILISLVPHTVKNTVLGYKNLGDIVNVECDMLVKFTAHLHRQNNYPASTVNCQPVLDYNFLQQCGFI